MTVSHSLRGLTPQREADLADRTDYLTEQLQHWNNVRQQQIAEGTASNITREDVQRGDLILRRNTWYPVVKVNKVSVSVPSIVGGSWTDTVRFEHIRDRVRPGDQRWPEVRDAALRDARLMSRNPEGLHPAFTALQPE